MLGDARGVRIRICDPFADGLRGFLRSARLSPGQYCELSGSFLLRHLRLFCSVGWCGPMLLADSLFCNPIPVGLSFHGDLRVSSFDITGEAAGAMQEIG